MQYFLNTVASLQSETFFKKVVLQVFSCKFCKMFQNTYFVEHLWMTGYSLVLYRLILKLEIFVTNKYCSPKIFIFTKKNTILEVEFYSIYKLNNRYSTKYSRGNTAQNTKKSLHVFFIRNPIF